MEDLDHVDYRPNENALRVRAHYVRDLQFVAGDGIFELVQIKRTASGVLYMETEIFVEIPKWAIGPGVAMTMRKVATAMTTPVIDAVAKAFGRAH